MINNNIFATKLYWGKCNHIYRVIFCHIGLYTSYLYINYTLPNILFAKQNKYYIFFPITQIIYIGIINLFFNYHFFQK